MLKTQRKLTPAQREMLVDVLTYGTMVYNLRARPTAMVLASEGLVHVDKALVPPSGGSGVMKPGISVTITNEAALDPSDFEVDPDSEFADWRVWKP